MMKTSLIISVILHTHPTSTEIHVYLWLLSFLSWTPEESDLAPPAPPPLLPPPSQSDGCQPDDISSSSSAITDTSPVPALAEKETQSQVGKAMATSQTICFRPVVNMGHEFSCTKIVYTFGSRVIFHAFSIVMDV